MVIELIDWIFYFTALSFILGSYFIFGLFFIRKYFKVNKGLEKKDQLPLVYGIGFFFFGLGRIFMTIFDLIVEFDISQGTFENILIWKFGSTLQLIGYSFFFILMEKRVMKGRDKYILVILYFAFFIIGLILPDIEAATPFFAISLILTTYIPLSYLYISYISDGEVRRKARVIFLGFLIIAIGLLMLAEQFLVVLSDLSGLKNIQWHVISNLLKSVGVCILFLGYK